MEKNRTGWRKGDARKAVVDGALVSFCAEKVEGGWLLRLDMHPALSRGMSAYLVDFRKNEPRLFARADSVLSHAADLGFDISRITAEQPNSEVAR